MDYDTQTITAADELIDAQLGWDLIAQHDADDYAAGQADYWCNEGFNPDMEYSPAYVAGYDAALAEDSYTEQPGYMESTRPDWF